MKTFSILLFLTFIFCLNAENLYIFDHNLTYVLFPAIDSTDGGDSKRLYSLQSIKMNDNSSEAILESEKKDNWIRYKFMNNELQDIIIHKENRADKIDINKSIALNKLPLNIKNEIISLIMKNSIASDFQKILKNNIKKIEILSKKEGKLLNYEISFPSLKKKWIYNFSENQLTDIYCHYDEKLFFRIFMNNNEIRDITFHLGKINYQFDYKQKKIQVYNAERSAIEIYDFSGKLLKTRNLNKEPIQLPEYITKH